MISTRDDNFLPVSKEADGQKIAFIIGNGFNFLVRDIVLAFPTNLLPTNLKTSKDDLANAISAITSLWRRFEELFYELKDKNPRLNDEELIRMIYSVIDFFSSIEAFQKALPHETIESIKEVFDFLLIDRIRDIAEEFRQHENSEGYKDLKRLFPFFGDHFKSILERNNIKDCDFFTTNYDGILDTLLTRSTRDLGYLTVDGFGNNKDYPLYLRLYDDTLQNNHIRCIHLHGSYRFEKKNGETLKTRNDNNKANSDPVIIFNNPLFKEQLIRRDPVLNHYYNFMSSSLEEADKLIIIGNSMQNEPHLKSLIQRKFKDPSQRLYICSRNPDQVADQFKGVYFKNIVKRSTASITTIEDFLSLFNSLMND
ncbi:SIR2 family protein [Spirosoma oryzicola]|uniref:SIR2 family protein n=1 Tax=Spirosoma oryzicola TaxID=2898794 RepID=UPI001E397820|nr:SIR2 family protein [Spirosoma oryzicola]UHG93304.1 SIR2 family protein [Spirosoma oryzicola]